MRKSAERRTKGFLLRRIGVAMIGALFFFGLAIAGYSNPEADSDAEPIFDAPQPPPAITGSVVKIETGTGQTLLLRDGTRGRIRISPDTELLIRPYVYRDGNILLEIHPNGFEDNAPTKKMVLSGSTIALAGLARNSNGNPAIIFLTPKLVSEDVLFNPDQLTIAE